MQQIGNFTLELSNYYGNVSAEKFLKKDNTIKCYLLLEDHSSMDAIEIDEITYDSLAKFKDQKPVNYNTIK